VWRNDFQLVFRAFGKSHIRNCRLAGTGLMGCSFMPIAGNANQATVYVTQNLMSALLLVLSVICRPVSVAPFLVSLGCI